MEAISVQKYILTSPKKIRQVVPMIIKMSPREAYDRLPFSGKRAGEVLRKVIGSALANAKQKGMKEDEILFKEIQVVDGPRLRRFRAGARGMAKPYRKKMSHIRVVLATKPEAKIKKSETKADDMGSKTETKVDKKKSNIKKSK